MISTKIQSERNSPSDNDFDKAVGERIRARRKQIKMNQGQLGEKIGVTFQQVQKYELGKNRVSASKLRRIAEAIQTTMASLLGESIDGIPAEVFAATKSPAAQELIKNFSALSPRLQQIILDLSSAICTTP